MEYEQVLGMVVYGNTVQDYLIAVFVLLLCWAVLFLFKMVVLTWLKGLAKKTHNDLDDMLIDAISKLGWPFYFNVSLIITLTFVEVAESIDWFVNYLMIVISAFYAVIIVQHFIDYAERKITLRQAGGDEAKIDDSIIKVLATFLKSILWVVAALTILANLGYNVTGLLAGAGILGIAIAFALQNVLSDLFASFSIYFDKPFRRGDFIVVGTDMGVVEHIGLKSTRLKTLQGQELIISNRELTETRINNFKKMTERRVVFEFGVTYETPTKKLKQIPSIIASVMDAVDNARLDRAHFKAFGDFSLDFEVVYYVLSANYAEFMDIQQHVNLEIKEHFEKRSIDFAYPTQLIYTKKG